MDPSRPPISPGRALLAVHREEPVPFSLAVHHPAPEAGRDAAVRAPRLNALREKSLARGVNPLLYWLVRALLVPFFLVYFRLGRIAREHIPSSGPVLLAANHRSFLDPFVIGALTRRPVYYMAKRELFERRWQAWLLSSLGAFPVDRGTGDRDAMATARAILSRGDCLVVFPEGTRVRSGPLGHPRRGIGRLALQSGAPVVPIAVIGTEHVRRGWIIRPRRVLLRCGRPLRYPVLDTPSPSIALGVAERIWACVTLQWQWQWLGGASPPPAHELCEESSPRAARAA
ncbi:MAG TPA: lysophospholipid acyltransferase family protein [Solirubrobacteraceae bacterium]|jgi:1-acyl-sn-glycerol-3-phosphate acyltransferase|nr:lysophospholipid acyltransferase family protein [Solirubrobacteraceae bacterium]